MRLAALLALGGCNSSNGGTTCNLGSATWVGYVDMSTIYYPLTSRDPTAPSMGGLAVFYPRADAGGYGSYASLGLDCGSAAGSGPCCYIPPPPDAGGDSSSSFFGLSDWTVTVTDENPDAGQSSGSIFLTDGGAGGGEGNIIASLTWSDWSGGDRLLIQGSGSGAVDRFSGQITAPLDFTGLNPGLFADAGTIPLGQDLALTWTPGGASSISIEALDQTTAGQVICSVPDDGSFKIPSSLLSHFQSGDQGGLLVRRPAESCAYSDNASISLLVTTETIVPVTFQ